MASRVAKLTIASILAAGVATVLLVQHKALEQLRRQNEQLEGQLRAAQDQLAVREPESTFDTNEVARLRARETELMKLRAEVTLLRRESMASSNRPAAVPPKNIVTREPVQAVDTAWVEQMVNSSPAQRGLAAGALRGKLLRGESTNVSPSEVAFQEALTQLQMNQTLERVPSDFADFQTAFIQGALGLSDATKLEQIHDVIQRTYEQAVANGLDVASKPATDSEAWVQRRFQLDRRATAAVEQLLTPDERRSFGRTFLGVMGVDLGTGVDKSNYPNGFLGP